MTEILKRCEFCGVEFNIGDLSTFMRAVYLKQEHIWLCSESCYQKLLEKRVEARFQDR
jgi:hypothetical protein